MQNPRHSVKQSYLNLQLLKNPWRLGAFFVVIAMLFTALWFHFHLLPGTTVAGVRLGNMTKSQAEAAIAKIPLNEQLTLNADKDQVQIPVTQLGASIDIPVTYATIQKTQTASLFKRSRRVFAKPVLKVDSTVLQQQLTDILAHYDVEPQNAELHIGQGTVVVTDEKMGKSFSPTANAASVEQAIESFTPQVAVVSQPLQPKVTAENLKGSEQQIGAMLATNVALSGGGDTFSLSPSQISQMLSYDPDKQTVSLDPAAVTAYVKRVATYIDANPVNEVHTSIDGREVSVTTGKDGQSLDQAATAAAVTKALTNAQPLQLNLPIQTVAHQVSYVKKTSPYGPRYIEVSISDQHLWVHENGSVVYDTAVTTGAVNAGNATPTGVYHIYSKQTSLHLTGPTWDDFVNYWLPFYGPYGLHDATWRAQFGTPDYADVGSHGCVNLPLAAASWIYNWSNVGTTVVVEG